MITSKQLITLQTYASEKNQNITLGFVDNRVVIYYLGKQYIGLSNKTSSMLTMKMVKSQIDKCALRNE